MNICCDAYEPLGCLNSCNALDLGLATENGNYTLLLSSGTELTLPFLIGDALIFDILLNENYDYTASLISPTDVKVCYQFKTYYTIVR